MCLEFWREFQKKFLKTVLSQFKQFKNYWIIDYPRILTNKCDKKKNKNYSKIQRVLHDLFEKYKISITRSRWTLLSSMTRGWRTKNEPKKQKKLYLVPRTFDKTLNDKKSFDSSPRVKFFWNRLLSLAFRATGNCVYARACRARGVIRGRDVLCLSRNSTDITVIAVWTTSRRAHGAWRTADDFVSSWPDLRSGNHRRIAATIDEVCVLPRWPCNRWNCYF